MKKNVGKTDKIVRIVLGVVFAGVSLFGVSGIWQIIFGIASGLMLFTAFTSFCGLYTLLGINTCKVEQDN